MSTMEKGILMLVLGLAGLIYLLPMAAGLYYEQQDRKKRGEPDESKAQYDERQKLIRLEAGNHALYALGGYLLLWMALEVFDALPWADRIVPLLGAGVLLALTVWSGECILRGAMLGFNQKRSEAGHVIMYFSLGTCWITIGCTNLDVMSGSLGAVQLLMGVSFLFQGVLMLYARRRRKKRQREDGDE